MNVAFRNTLGYVTDGPNTYAELLDFGMGTNYPTVAPWGGNVGWNTITSIDSFNGNAGNDPRIAGATYCDDQATYRIALPAPGTYPISVAMGSQLGATSASLEIRDGSGISLGFAIPFGVTTSAAQRFRDIANTEYTQLTWPAGSQPVNYTFTTTDARFVIYEPVGTIAYISIGDVIFPARAVVDYRDVASTGGASLLKVVYAVTFSGVNVSEAIATQRQREIVVEMENDFTVAERRAAITEAVQEIAAELGLTVISVDILSLGEITPPEKIFDVQYGSDIAVGAAQGGWYFDIYNQLMITKDSANRAYGYTGNSSIADQSVPAVDVYLTDSDLRFPSFGAQTRMRFKWTVSFAKTAAGVAAPIYNIRLGQIRATTDPLVLALTGPAQTAVVDLGTLTVWGTIRTIGASGIIRATAEWTHKGQTGFANNVDGHVDGTSAAFNLSALQGYFLGLSINPGAAGAWTASQVWGEAWW